MARLTDMQVVKITSAAVTMTAYDGLCSEFEFDTMGEICRRFLRDARQTVITEAEWKVVDDVVAANPGSDFLVKPTRASA